VDTEVLYDLANQLGVELVVIGADTTARGFEKELRWNAAYHRLARGL
jgi:L-arabinose isomerase